MNPVLQNRLSRPELEGFTGIITEVIRCEAEGIKQRPERGVKKEYRDGKPVRIIYKTVHETIMILEILVD